jgi:ubiquinone/menaquinone biosynthesis C-methylase UbiE
LKNIKININGVLGIKFMIFFPILAGQTVLDLGCAVRDQAADFIKRGARVIGVDINNDLLNEARSRFPKSARFIIHQILGIYQN